MKIYLSYTTISIMVIFKNKGPEYEWISEKEDETMNNSQNENRILWKISVLLIVSFMVSLSDLGNVWVFVGSEQ